jgi:hypothetical protein
MRRLAVISCLILMSAFGCISLKSQTYDFSVYNAPLSEVLGNVQHRYDVKIEYSETIVRDKVVTYAPWKFYSSLDETLAHILYPLNLTWTVDEKGVCHVKPWQYFNRTDEEGKKALDALLASYPTLNDWQARKAALRNNIISVTGIDKFPRPDKINTVRSNFRKYGRYTVENIAIEILDGVWVCGSLYMPAKYKSRIPIYLCTHGHAENQIINERGRYRPMQQYRCAELAMMGVACYSYDMWAWGESTLCYDHKDHASDLGLIMQTWQSTRILDYFCQQPWVDVDRVGVSGESGGGTQTMIITAIDDRVKLSVPVVMLSSHFWGGCACESGLPIHSFKDGSLMSNNAEIGAMCAPRPLLVISDGADWTSSVPAIEYPYLKKVFALYDAQSNVENAHFENEQHDYGPSKRFAMYDFTAKHWGIDNSKFRKDDGTYDESKVVIEPAEEMFVFGKDGSQLPKNAIKGSDNLRKLLSQYK